ncbi:MAG: hypothetical protein Q8M76_05460, partial [Spirochaetaceae bacterium]|nr:hypothetical protein [Spirochaetaceae bacterium]
MSSLRIDTSAEGFTLSVGDRRVLVHTRRAPCLDVAVAEGVPGRPPRRRSLVLRSFAISRPGEECLEIRFEGKIALTVLLAEGKLRLAFAGLQAPVASFALRLAAQPDESIYGCGARYGKLDLKGTRVELKVEDEAPPTRSEFLARFARLARRLSGEGATSRYPVP